MKLMQIYDSLIMDARIINPDTYKETDPIMDFDVIRVYHGFSNYSADYAPIFAKFGLSGKIAIDRTYSYEYVNNPKGLFVTIDPKIAMNRFGSSGYVIEFHTKVSDLEAPVWNSDNGGYFVQGQYTKGFDSDGDRELKRTKEREKYQVDLIPAVSKSDRPELAHWLIDGAERQALFTGDLNANMIRAFWVNDLLITKQRTGGIWKRLSRLDFIKKYPIQKHQFVGNSKPEYSDKYYKAKEKVFRPTDNFSIDAMLKIYGGGNTEEKLIDTLVKHYSDHDLLNFMYPKQITQFRNKYGYNKK